MKQLKFMLAAAAAFGIATAQAGEKTTYLVGTAADAPENFDAANLADQNPVGAIAGYDFQPVAPATAADNESVIKDGALNVNTGTDPLLRALDYQSSVNPVSVTNKSLYINTKVQFTVTPADDSVDAKTGDKLMLFFKEVKDAETGKITATNLFVKTLSFVASIIPELPDTVEAVTIDTGIGFPEIEPNEWYDLKVSASAVNLGDGRYLPTFGITVGNTALDAKVSLANGDVNTKLFPAITGAEAEPTLTYVGFAGEGKVDDLLVWTVETISSVDFTLTLGTGVSAVQWTINDNDKTNADTFSATAGTTLNVAIKSVTYDAGYAGTQDWTAWTYSAAASGSIEITAEKFADVAADGTATPTDDTVKAVTEGAFKVPEATEGNAEAVAEAKADLAKALTWASSKAGKSYTAAIAAINGMTFDEDGDPSGTGDAKTNAEAYLLDCAANQNAIDEAMEDFVLTGFSIGADGAMTFGVGEDAKGNGAAYANGKIEVRGKAALNAANWVKDCPGATFFKAFLVK